MSPAHEPYRFARNILLLTILRSFAAADIVLRAIIVRCTCTVFHGRLSICSRNNNKPHWESGIYTQGSSPTPQTPRCVMIYHRCCYYYVSCGSISIFLHNNAENSGFFKFFFFCSANLSVCDSLNVWRYCARVENRQPRQ